MPEQIAETVVVTGIRRGAKMPKAMWRITLEGRDLTDKIDPHLISATLCEKNGKEADQVDLTITDPLGAIPLPPKGATLRVELGWERGAGLPLGLVDKGTFKVDERAMAGGPDTIKITARSANLTNNFRVRRGHANIGKTLGEILTAIAHRNNVILNIDADLRPIIIPNFTKPNLSDAAAMAQLAARVDAVASIKNGNLIFTKTGATATPRGTTLGEIEIKRIDTAPNFSWGENDRSDYNGTKSEYHDRKTQTRQTVTHGHDANRRTAAGETVSPRRTRRTHHNRTDAEHKAKATHQKTGRGKTTMNLTLKYGRPDFTPNRIIKLTGFRPEINAKKWLLVECNHTMDANGLGTRLNLESLA